MVLQILIYGLIFGTQVLLFALALHVAYAVSKVHNLAFGAVSASVAYALYYAMTVVSLPLVAIIALPLFTAAGLGVACYALNESFTRRQQPLFALLVSFSFGALLESVITILFGTDGKNFTSGVIPVLSLGRYIIPFSGLGIILFGAISAIIIFIMTRYTPWGRVFKAIAENQFSSVSLGMNQKKIRVVVYIIASIIVGVIGILSGLNTALIPSMGFNLVIMAFIAFLIGGVTDMRGTIIASYLIALIPEFVIDFSNGLSSNWRMVIVFGVAFMFLTIFPNGLLSPVKRKG
jgi:branched-subunit amino acid ABC-type transport system permease component